jgi:hypothetical protein
MNQYHKINSLFKRDQKGKLLLNEYSRPEFEYLKNCSWVLTEKVDGTNIRVMYDPKVPSLGGEKLIPWVSFNGKTDNAQMPAPLVAKLRELFPVEIFQDVFDCRVCLYGEGFGAKIQKGGGNYIKDAVDFVLFDVKIEEWWLKREDIEDIATRLGIQVVPIIDEGTLGFMENLCRTGFKSQWGDFIAEGIVAKPAVELKTRSGERIITKLKYKDFN